MSDETAPLELALGLDMGGTNIRAAVITRSGQIVARRRLPTPYDEDGALALPPVWVEVMAECAAPLLAEYDVIGAGLACGGQFDPWTGRLRGTFIGDARYENHPVGEMLRERLGLPVVVDNDVKMAALGELMIGAGQGYRCLVCVAVGTYVGGGLILDGCLFHGSSGLAGHIGQLIDPQTGTYIQDVCGGAAMIQRAITRGILQPGEDGQALFEQARAGIKAAQAHIHETGVYLGRALAGLCHAIEPEVILMGGTVGLQPEFRVAVGAGLAGCLLPNWQHITVKPVALGADAGQIGAAQRVFLEAGATR
jgi:predicted NBD/HSP70 family sugar kinase